MVSCLQELPRLCRRLVTAGGLVVLVLMLTALKVPTAVGGQLGDATRWDSIPSGQGEATVSAAKEPRIDGQWSALGSGTNGIVWALTSYGGRIIAGGDFTQAGGTAAAHVAQWDGQSWSALGSGLNGSVYDLVVYNGDLIAGGIFTQSGSTSVSRIARWNGSSWQPLGSGVDGTVVGLGLYGTRLVAGGYFTHAGGNAANRIASWDGVAWSALGSGMNNIVSAIVEYNGDLVASGYFTQAGSVAASRIARWNGGTWSPLGAGLDNLGRTLATQGNVLLVGGDFQHAGGVAASRIAAWSSSTWSAYGAGTNNMVHGLAVDGGASYYAGGYFTTAGGGPAAYVAYWDGATWSALGSGMNSLVREVLWAGTSLYVGGDFTTAGGAAASRIARWQPSVVSGACCFPDGRCEMLAVDVCTQAGGTPIGPASVCSPNPCPMTLVHLTDVHVGAGVLHPDADQRWPAALASVSGVLSPKPVAVVVTGDNVQWGSGSLGVANYAELLLALYPGSSWYDHYADEAQSIPVYFSPGNHDYAFPPELVNYYLYLSQDNYYKRIVKDAIVVYMLDGGYDQIGSHCSCPPAPPEEYVTCRLKCRFHPEGSGVSASALDWLEDDLSQTDDRYCKVVCLHHPFVNPGSNLDLLDQVFLQNRARFDGICTGYGVDAILCGHIHGQADFLDGSWDLGGGRWDPGDGPRLIATASLAGDGQGRIIHVQNGDVVGYDNVWFGSTLSGVISCNAEVVVSDGSGRQARALGDGSTMVEIPGGWYMVTVADSAGYRETLHEFGLVKADTSAYAVVIRSLIDGPVDVRLTTTLVNGYRTTAMYDDVAMLSGSLGMLRTEEAMWDYEMTIVAPDSSIRFVWPNGFGGNWPPVAPGTPVGPSDTVIGREETYETSASDPEGQDVMYEFSWGDGSLSPWIGPYPSGVTCSLSHVWYEVGSYEVKVRAKDPGDQLGVWSDPLVVDVRDGSNVPDLSGKHVASIGFSNPYRPGAAMRVVSSSDGCIADVSIHDVSGRLVRKVYRGLVGVDGKEVSWDGLTDSGQWAGSGVYYLWAKVGVDRLRRTIVFVR